MVRKHPEGSGTAKLMGDPSLLASKLREETEELIQALQAHEAPTEVIHEAADLLYFTLVRRCEPRCPVWRRSAVNSPNAAYGFAGVRWRRSPVRHGPRQ